MENIECELTKKFTKCLRMFDKLIISSYLKSKKLERAGCNTTFGGLEG